MRAWVDDEGWITLDDANLVAEGGQGRVFAQGRRAYKIASTPEAVLDPAKLATLALIRSDRVIRPLASIRTAPGCAPIGHAMARVERAVPWMQLVPRAARARLGIDRTAALALCEALQAIVADLHALDIAVVDLSSGNVLVDTRRRVPYLIDVDSAQTPGFPATAITPQITDPLAHGRFGPASDWFAFAVLSFELLVGIHPFRGTHPSVHGLEARMAAGLSVLDRAVKLPPACDDPRALPSDLLQWFGDTFAGKLRAPPPLPLCSRPTVRRARTRISIARSDGAPIRGVLGESPVWWWTDAHIGCGDSIVATTPTDAIGLVRAPSPSGAPSFTAMLCHGDDGTVSLVVPGSTCAIDLGVKVSALRVDGGAIVLRCGDRVGVLDLHARSRDAASRSGAVWASIRALARVSAASCTLWSGCATSRQLGGLRVHMLAQGGRRGFARELVEIAGDHIVDAAANGGIVMLLVESARRHDRWIFGMCPPWCGLVHVERDVDPLGCAVVRASDGTLWVRRGAGMAPLHPNRRGDGLFGDVVDVGDGVVPSR